MEIYTDAQTDSEDIYVTLGWVIAKKYCKSFKKYFQKLFASVPI